jgi:2-iminoacetate synthase
MALSKNGEIQNCCHPNALMTLKEYLEDYSSSDTKSIGETLITAELSNIPREKVRELVIRNLDEINAGHRDFRL